MYEIFFNVGFYNSVTLEKRYKLFNNLLDKLFYLYRLFINSYEKHRNHEIIYRKTITVLLHSVN